MGFLISPISLRGQKFANTIIRVTCIFICTKIVSAKYGKSIKSRLGSEFDFHFLKVQTIWLL